eukprot:1151450-Pelagomonas_calceolata.AAC.4
MAPNGPLLLAPVTGLELRSPCCSLGTLRSRSHPAGLVHPVASCPVGLGQAKGCLHFIQHLVIMQHKCAFAVANGKTARWNAWRPTEQECLKNGND